MANVIYRHITKDSTDDIVDEASYYLNVDVDRGLFTTVAILPGRAIRTCFAMSDRPELLWAVLIED